MKTALPVLGPDPSAYAQVAEFVTDQPKMALAECARHFGLDPAADARQVLMQVLCADGEVPSSHSHRVVEHALKTGKWSDRMIRNYQRVLAAQKSIAAE